MNWKQIVSGIAPTIATMLGGPLAGAGVAAISRAIFGHENATEAEAAVAVMTMTPEQRTKLAEIDADLKKAVMVHAEKMGQQIIDDRISARSRDSEFVKAGKHNVRGDILAYSGVGALVILALLTFIFEIDQTTKEILIFILGVLSKIVGDVYSFEFGSSKGEQAKSEKIAKWLDEA